MKKAPALVAIASLVTLSLAAPAQALNFGPSGELPATFNDQGMQAPAFPSAQGAAFSTSGANKALQRCLGDIRKAGAC